MPSLVLAECWADWQLCFTKPREAQQHGPKLAKTGPRVGDFARPSSPISTTAGEKAPNMRPIPYAAVSLVDSSHQSSSAACRVASPAIVTLQLPGDLTDQRLPSDGRPDSAQAVTELALAKCVQCRRRLPPYTYRSRLISRTQLAQTLVRFRPRTHSVGAQNGNTPRNFDCMPPYSRPESFDRSKRQDEHVDVTLRSPRKDDRWDLAMQGATSETARLEAA